MKILIFNEAMPDRTLASAYPLKYDHIAGRYYMQAESPEAAANTLRKRVANVEITSFREGIEGPRVVIKSKKN